MSNKPFVHLHTHTEYSLLDGAARISRGNKSPLFEACKERNMPAVAITDHGNMYGAYTFYKCAKKHGIKPIIGCEFYVCEDMHIKNPQQSSNHLILLAKNNIGYKNLVKLDSLAFIEGFYRRPRIDLNFLEKHSEGLICLSACLAGYIPEKLLMNDYEAAKEHAIKLKNMFAPGDFYIELQDHDIEDQKRVNPLLVKIAKEIGVKCVATNDAHYVSREDFEMHDVLLCMQTGKKIDDPNRMRFQGDQFYLKDYSEMYQKFSWIEEALDNTIEIANKCNVEIKKEDLFPPYNTPTGESPEEFLKKICYEGLNRTYDKLTPNIIERAEYELSIIVNMGFAEYYLIVWDFVDFARKNNIPVGPGRGSGVGSIVAYALGITNVDPLKYNLIFERFLNTDRISNPDFDIDFCVDGRSKVIEYVIDKYGKDKVCQIITFGTLAARAAFKDAARVYSIPFDISNKIAKLIPQNISLDEALGVESRDRISPELIEEYNKDESIKKALDMARKVEGMPKNSSTHAAGVVICKEVISDFVPLQKNGEDITTQYQKDEVEALGMLKMDFLGLRTLTDISKSIQYAKETQNVDINFNKIGYEDPQVYALIASGDTDAVFQLESQGMKSFMKDLSPTRMEDIIAGISLYRPGPMNSIPAYVNGKKNPRSIVYAHPLLEPILNVTYGCIVYQEQVMQIARSLGGYTLGRADVLRYAMGKKKEEQMNSERQIFIYGKDIEKCKANEEPVDGAIKRGVPEDVAIHIFDEMKGFGKYAFNKSHAAGYAVLAYQTAYMKNYYPVEFITAVLNNRITDFKEIAKYIGYIRAKNVEVFPPNINKSEAFFKVENGGIRFALCAVKGVGLAAIQEIINERNANGEFTSFVDMVNRVSHTCLNKKLVEALIKTGAFDGLGENRATLAENYEDIIKDIVRDKKIKSTGQISFFDYFGLEASEKFSDIPKFNEYATKEILKYEKEFASVYFSGHPLDEWLPYIEDKMAFNLSMVSSFLKEQEVEDSPVDDALNSDIEDIDLISEYSEREVSFAGIISSISKINTRKNQTMAYLKIEDPYCEVECMMFPRQYGTYKGVIEEDKIVICTGKFKTDELPWKFVISSIKVFDPGDGSALDEGFNKKSGVLYLNFTNASAEDRDEVLEILKKYKGGYRVVIQMNGEKYAVKNSLVPNSKELSWKLTGILGHEAIKFIDD